MNRITFLATALALGLLPLSAQAQVFGINQNFEGPLPGALPSGGNEVTGFTFGGVSGGVDPFNPNFPHEITSSGGVGGSQSYQITFDTSGVAPAAGQDFDFYFGGLGIFAGFFGNGSRTGEAFGADDPANWRFSVDVRSEGALDPNAVLNGSFVYFDPDYDETFGIDGDGDGAVSGADTYRLPLTFTDDTSDSDFTTNSFTLDVGTGEAPTTEVDGDIPRFNDDGNWVLNFSFGGGEYGNDAGNLIALDNLIIEFIPPEATPGDYNGDGSVGGADYTLARDFLGQATTLLNEGDGITPDSVTAEDITFVISQFGAPDAGTASALSSVSVVPEPASAVLVVTTGMLGLCLRRRR